MTNIIPQSQISPRRVCLRKKNARGRGWSHLAVRNSGAASLSQRLDPWLHSATTTSCIVADTRDAEKLNPPIKYRLMSEINLVETMRGKYDLSACMSRALQDRGVAHLDGQRFRLLTSVQLMKRPYEPDS